MGHAITKYSQPKLITADDTQFSVIPETNSDIVQSRAEGDNRTRSSLGKKLNILSQIRNAVSWPRMYNVEQFTEFQDCVHKLFQNATKETTALTKEKKYSQVEEIVNAIRRLVSGWDKDILNSLHLKSFTREIINLEVKRVDYTIYAGVYFEAEPFYAGDNRLVVLYYFDVSESTSKSKIMSYYLECSNIVQPYFVVGLSVSGSHLRVCSFDRCCPSYWVVRETILQDIKLRINAGLHVKNTSKCEEHDVEEDLREGIIV